MNANLYARLFAAVGGERPCLELEGGRCLDYATLQADAARYAGALQGLGLVPGDVVAVMAEKSAAVVALYLGCLRAGLVYHPLNTGYTARELAFYLGDSGSRLLVHDPALEERAVTAAAACARPPRRVTLDAAGGGELATLAEGAVPFDGIHPCAEDTVAALLYSSGTTGTPKGIPLSHGNLAVNAAALREAWEFVATDVLVHALPLYHVHGLFITLGPCLLAGARLRLLPRFEATAVRAALAGATLMAGVPTYYTRLLADPGFGRADCRTVRLFISGSAPLAESTFHAFAERTGHVILERYGMTETGILTSNPLTGERRAGTVGRPLPGVEVRVRDNDGRPCAVGDVGEIEVRGANVFRGYLALPEKTAEAFTADGFFRTGDQGAFDPDGYLTIAGRSKDMVISGGLNVYPKEIETEIERAAGVTEAAVFGVPHADFGEAVVAAVTAAGALDEEGLRAALRERLAGYKVPKRILQVDELPRNSMGKVQKNVLRERYAGLFADPRAASGSL